MKCSTLLSSPGAQGAYQPERPCKLGEPVSEVNPVQGARSFWSIDLRWRAKYHIGSAALASRKGKVANEAGRIAVLILVLVTSVANPASAHISLCGSPGSFFAGNENFTQDNRGARANIENYSPSVCDTSDTFSLVWTMIHGSAHCDGWAQTGYVRDTMVTGALTKWFQQSTKINPSDPACNATGNPHTVYDQVVITGECPGTFTCPEYRTTRYPSDGKIRMMVIADKTYVLWITTFDPLSWWTLPIHADFYAETLHQETNIPGDSVDHVSLQNIMEKDVNDNWVTRTLTPNTPVCRYQRGIGSILFDVWTYPEHSYC
jgi:hypothetical protein